MTSRVVTEPELRDLVTAHRLWLQDVERGTTSPGASQLQLQDAVLVDLTWVGELLANAQLVRCRLERCAFEACDFSYCLFFNSDLSGSVFVDCNLRKAELNGAACAGARFLRCDLSAADLSRADLRGADLTDADLGWAWLVNTDLREATLEGTRLQGARFSNAKLSNSRRFHLGSLEGAVVDDVEIGRDGDGTRASGVEALDFLRA